MTSLSRKIKGGVRKDINVLLESLSAGEDDAKLIRSAVTKIAELVDREDALVEDRKKLSRQIGTVRAEGNDPSDLIEQVSTLSASIKQIKADIEQNVEQIEACVNRDSHGDQAVSGADPAPMPAHLAPKQDELDLPPCQLRLACEDEINVPEWQAFVDSQSHACVYHDARWHHLVKRIFGHNPKYITCRGPDDALCGVLPMVHLSSRLFGSFLVSMPYFNYGGPLATSAAVAEKMMQYAAEVGESLGCTHWETRDTHRLEPWLCKQHKVTMILPLPQTDEVLDKQLGTKIRAQVKRSAKEGLEFTLGGIELLPEFYHVFSHNMRDLGTPVYSRQFFASMLATFEKEANVTIVRYNGKPVAAGFLLGFREKLEIPWASSLRKANPLGANMYMYRQILRVAIEQNYRFFDFGRSSKGASTYKYKKQWGATEHPLYWHYWLSDADELPELNPNNPKYKLAIAVWQKLPVPVANRLGPPLVRNLP